MELSASQARDFCGPFLIVCALPGAGKSSTVTMLNEPFDDGNRIAVDLDIQGPKGLHQPKDLNKAVSFYVRAAVNSRVVVFSYLHYFQWEGVPNVPVLVVIPKEEVVAEIVQRIAERDPGSAFAEIAPKVYPKWVSDWKVEARRLQDDGRKITLVELDEGEYLSDVIARVVKENAYDRK